MYFLPSLLLLFTILPSRILTVPDNIPLPDDFDHVNRAPPQTFVINRWAISAGSDTKKQIPLGMLRYAPNSLAPSYTPMTGAPNAPDGELYRVGITKGGKWVGSVRSGKMLKDNLPTTVTLHIDKDGEIFHIAYDTVAKRSDVLENTEPEVLVVKPWPGATPILNKPVVLMPDGRAPQVEEEKTFLQKYWWVLLAGVVLLFAGPSDSGK